MNTKTIVFQLSTLASTMVFLAACGGGGGGGDTTPPPATGGSIAGVAAKGILKNAAVTAYCGNNETDQLDSKFTDTAGAYSLNWTTACTKPLKLVVKPAGAGTTATTMADEATGADVLVSAGFKLSALVADPSNTTTKNITPFTDMAVAVAGTASTPAAISNAELAIVNTVLGGDKNAYDAKPVAPTAAAMAVATADEKKLATLLTAISAFAQDATTACGALTTGDAAQIECAINTFATQAAATVTGVSDTGYTVASAASTPASMLATTLAKITAGTMTGMTATDLSTDITSDTSGVTTLLAAAEDKVATAAASNGGTVIVDAGSASGIQAARNLFSSLNTDVFALSNSNGNGFLDQKLSAAKTDWSTNGHASATGFVDYTTAINRAMQMANEAKTANWTIAATALQPNTLYPVPNANVLLETDSNGQPQSYLRSFFGVNINNQPDDMNCRVLVTDKTNGLGNAGCYYSTGQANVSLTSTTFTGFYHAVEVAESATTSGTFTWQDYTASRTYTTTRYSRPLGVEIFGNANFVPSSAPTPGTKQSGTAVLTKDAISGNLTALSFKGDIQPLATGQDKSTLDISAGVTSTSTTQTANISGTVSNVQGTTTTLTMAISSGSQIVASTGTAGQPVSANFVTQMKTTGFQYDGTLAMDTFTADKAGNFQPANSSFIGKVSTVANGTATEFLNGTLSLKQTNLASFDPRVMTSANNFLQQTASFTGTVTNGSAIYVLTFIGDGSVFGAESVTLNYTRNGTQMISFTGTKSATAANTITVSGAGNVTATLVDGIGDVKVGTTKVGTVTKNPSQVTFIDGTYLLLGV